MQGMIVFATKRRCLSIGDDVWCGASLTHLIAHLPVEMSCVVSIDRGVAINKLLQPSRPYVLELQRGDESMATEDRPTGDLVVSIQQVILDDET